MKRGQITIFVIVGVLVVLVIIGLFLLANRGDEKESTGPEVDSYKEYMRGCVNDEALLTVEYFGMTPNMNEEVSVFFVDGEREMSTSEDFLEAIGNDLEMGVEKCASDFGSEKGYDVNIGNGGEVITTLADESVIFEVNLPVTLKKEGKTYSVINLGETVLDVRLEAYLNTIEKIVDEQGDNPDEFCFTCIVKFAEENDVYVNISLTENEDGLDFKIFDEYSEINGEPFVLNFVMEYES